MKILAYDPSACFCPRGNLPADALSLLAASLEASRRQLLTAAEPEETTGQTTHFSQGPRQLLHDYNTTRPTSVLYQLLRTANRLRDLVDRVVIVSPTRPRLAVQALWQTCCDPFFNELSRGERGSRPRIYFDGDHWDNDLAQGLLQLLRSPAPGAMGAAHGGTDGAGAVERRWAVVAIDPTPASRQTTISTPLGPASSPLLAAVHRYREALRRQCADDWPQQAQRLVVVAPANSALHAVTADWTTAERYVLPEQHDEFESVFTVAGLLPAAILGIDVVKLLHAAVALQEHFEWSPVGGNAVLDFVGMAELWRQQGWTAGHHWFATSPTLSAAREWAEQLLAASGNDYAGASGSSLRPTRTDPAGTQIVIERWRCDAVTVPEETGAAVTLPQLAQQADVAACQTSLATGTPRAILKMPRMDEEGLGQFFQMLLLIRAMRDVRSAS